MIGKILIEGHFFHEIDVSIFS